MTTRSNEDCSEHLLTGCKDGTLVRLKKDHLFYKTGKATENDNQGWVFPTIRAGDILILLGQQAWKPETPLGRHCWYWTFYFLHKDYKEVHFFWDMNSDTELNLDTVFELPEVGRKREPGP